ncbi:MAG: alpha/beta hydrolase-fold protein [Candidatus Aminicenantales bacterium]
MKKAKFLSIFCALFLVSTASFFSQEAAAPTQRTDIILGQTLTLTSKTFNRDVPVLVHVPNGYAAGSTRYPVLYVLNAYPFAFACGTVELLAGITEIPEMIVVGVPPFDRGYVPTPFEERGESPTPADLSIQFLKEELIPFMDNNYRTNAFRILYGHSVGGLFTMYTLFNHPDLFAAYLAGSPWFQTLDQYWLKNIEKMAKMRNLDNKFLHMTVGNQEIQLTIDTYRELEKWMNAQSFGGFTWKSAWMDGDHGSMVGRVIYDGLVFFFNGWKLPQTAMMDGDVEKIDAHIKTISAKWGKYGFDASVIIPEGRLNALGYVFINRNELDKAIRILSYNIRRFPKSFNAHDSLAEAYMIKGDKENAIKYYKLAIELNPGDTDYAKRVLQNSKDKLRELGVEK